MEIVRTHGTRTVALAISLLYAVGATVGVVTLLLPAPASFNEVALWTNVALAYGAAIAFAVTAGRNPIWFVHLGLIAGTALITRAIELSPGGGILYSFWYVWVGLFAFVFFGRVAGLLHTAWIGIAFAWVLTQVHAPMPIAGWLMVVTSIGVAGAMVNSIGQSLSARAHEAAARARALGAVTSVAHELSRRTSPETAAPAICNAVVDVTDARSAALWQPASGGTQLVATASTEERLVGTRIEIDQADSALTRVYESCLPEHIADYEKAQGSRSVMASRYGARSSLLQPIVREQRVVGVLCLYWQQPRHRIDPVTLELASLLADEAAIAIERTQMLSQLNHAARTDELTGLPNRRSWDEHLDRELARASRSGRPLSVAMFDLDHFKEYNDRHGHQAGDRMLKLAAAEWRERVRESDFLARYGGEEFVLALPDCPLERAEQLVDELRRRMPGRGRCSAGVVAWDGSETADELVDRADQALYAAKRHGRNRVATG